MQYQYQNWICSLCGKKYDTQEKAEHCYVKCRCMLKSEAFKTGYVTNEAEWGTLEREIRAERKKMLDKAFNDEMRRFCDRIRHETQE